MNVETQQMLTRLVANATEEHQLETDLVNLMLVADDEQINEIHYFVHDKLCEALPDRRAR